ncbi:polysaccharide pyruvyl transferase family protein [Gulosibacter sediminis]|uniref:polysaccharide pyruvyl transferase family protein n=1 Tax=Gulosibacter sediminis TaxID=1729695 RepID=UPI0024AD0077|nr:polysaccharide pyruvyl transferase family protein [Gulosibacter sediminis]
MINIYAHKTTVRGDSGNLGDMMGFHIADWLLGPDKYRRLGIRQKDALPAGTISLVGSVIAGLVDAPVRIIGGGLINGNPRQYGSDISIEAVRGFLTQSVIERDTGQVPVVIADPGMLLSRIAPLAPVPHRKKMGFIIHDVDRDEFANRYPDQVENIVDNYAPKAEFVRQLSGYEAIASTSLHGCIFAHSYGIPVAPFVLTDRVFGGDFKFRDHYSAFGIDARRNPLDGPVESVLASVMSFPQPTRDQSAQLMDLQIQTIARALRA